MKYWELLNALDLIRSDAKVKNIYRSNPNQILIDFYDEAMLIDLTPSNSLIVFLDKPLAGAGFATPFDVLLDKRINRSTLTKATVAENDKILHLEFTKIASFKEERTTLILELTGRYTNAIIVDENGVIVESIKRISNSVRTINNGEIYIAPPPPPKPPKISRAEDIRGYLLDLYKEREQKELSDLKEQHTTQIDKKIEGYQKIISELPTIDELQKEADRYALEAGLILNNIHQIQKWAKSVDLIDYEGKTINIDLEGHKNPQIAANAKFAKSKRVKAKAKGLYQELENLQSRVDFYCRIKNSISNAKTLEELNSKIPQKPTKSRHSKIQNDPIDYFVIEGYKVGVGRNERGNIALLKNAKANDIWMHIKDTPSAHLIITNPKSTPPDSVIEQAAKLCVELSTAKKGQFLVDYTPRRFVKIVERAFVNYTNYKTVSVKVE